MSEPEIDLRQLQQMAQVNRKVINRLKDRVAILENAVELVCDDPQMAWLYRNRSERMDPTVPLFAKGRAGFHLARYEYACQYAGGKRIADIACGTGYGVRMLVEQGKADFVQGIDVCPDTIKYAGQRHGVPNSQFECADAADNGLPDASFDLVTSFETLEHLNNEQQLLSEFARVLRPGGQLICSTPNGWDLAIAEHHVRVYNRDSFLAALNENFEVTELFNQNSGTDFKYNHDQPAGIVPCTDANHHLAECFIAVAKKK